MRAVCSKAMAGRQCDKQGHEQGAARQEREPELYGSAWKWRASPMRCEHANSTTLEPMRGIDGPGYAAERRVALATLRCSLCQYRLPSSLAVTGCLVARRFGPVRAHPHSQPRTKATVPCLQVPSPAADGAALTTCNMTQCMETRRTCEVDLARNWS